MYTHKKYNNTKSLAIHLGFHFCKNNAIKNMKGMYVGGSAYGNANTLDFKITEITVVDLSKDLFEFIEVEREMTSALLHIHVHCLQSSAGNTHLLILYIHSM